MACGNLPYLKSLSGIFRSLAVVTGIPAIVLAWIAYFSSSWTNVFPEILAILAVEKSFPIDRAEDLDREEDSNEDSTTNIPISDENDSSSSSSEEIDIISDKEEEYLDEILLKTLMYEKFFIGIVSVLFLLSAAYLLLRIVSKHQPDSVYEIMFDFIFHVVGALGLLTGSGLVLLSAAKIQNFVDQVNDRDGFAPPEIVDIIQKNQNHVQDKSDKIAAAVIGMLNGIFYALCVITIKMTDPVHCKSKKTVSRRSMKTISTQQQRNSVDMPVFSVMSSGYQNQTDPAYGSYGFSRYNNNNNAYIYD